jgi:hypothetical protein
MTADTPEDIRKALATIARMKVNQEKQRLTTLELEHALVAKLGESVKVTNPNVRCEACKGTIVTWSGPRFFSELALVYEGRHWHKGRCVHA